VGRLLLGSVAATAVFAVAACSAVGGTGGELDGTSWTLEMYDASGSPTAVPAGVTADARFTGNRISGFGGCNVFNGDAVASGSALKIGPLATTQMACSGDPGTVETAYLANLGRAATYTATTTQLTLFDVAGKQVLAYRIGPVNPLVGAWSVTGINNGRQAVVSPETGTTVTATFTADGKVAGSGGCNDYTGSYTITGQQVAIGPLASTRMACEPAIMTQEAQFFTAMDKVTTLDPSGAMIMLRDASGAMQVVLTTR